jgi:predicted flap endonuclease-1-like 5' DNA nuclease
MPYTLMKGLVWVALAVVLGIVIGWFLRSVAARRQIRRARADQADQAELERLRGRVANLEPVVAERDRLQAELTSGRVSPGPPDSPTDDGVRGIATIDEAAEPAVTVEASAASLPATPDLDGAAVVLGGPIELDDLKVIEGIGPKIEELCHGIGIRTWFDLSTTEVSLLCTMLADAGSRFRSHDPATWPDQAALLASGRWAEFRTLTDELTGGRAVD